MLLQRDDREPAVVDVPTSYRQLLREYRQSQLEMSAANVKRMEGVYQRAIASLAKQVRDVPNTMLSSGEMLQQEQARALIADLDKTLADLQSDYATLLSVGMADVAQNAADREAATARLVGAKADLGLAADMSTTRTLSNGAHVAVRFGRMAASAIERSANRVYSDGWKLSDRLYSLDAQTRAVVQDTIVQGVAEQISARKLAGRLKEALSTEKKDCPRYRAMRIARTEINAAHREAHIQSTLDPETGQKRDWIRGVQWNLSSSHVDADICDVWADDDTGLGEGVYDPADVPSEHPHGLCFTITVLADYPESATWNRRPDAVGCPESQAAYYVSKYEDPAAKRWLAAAGGDE